MLLKGCGHLPFSDDPERCAALILAPLPYTASANGSPSLDKDT